MPDAGVKGQQLLDDRLLAGRIDFCRKAEQMGGQTVEESFLGRAPYLPQGNGRQSVYRPRDRLPAEFDDFRLLLSAERIVVPFYSGRKRVCQNLRVNVRIILGGAFATPVNGYLDSTLT